MKQGIRATSKGLQCWIVCLGCCLGCIACKDEVSVEMNVWRDCTGTYLQQGDIDYKVCNPGTVADFSTGQTVDAIFSLVDKCDDPSVTNFACNLWHDYEALIQVTEITD